MISHRFFIVKKKQSQVGQSFPIDFIFSSWHQKNKPPRKTVTGRGIDEGTYGVVYRACEIDTGEVVALKQLKLGAVKSEEGFPVPGLPGLPGLGCWPKK